MFNPKHTSHARLPDANDLVPSMLLDILHPFDLVDSIPKDAPIILPAKQPRVPTKKPSWKSPRWLGAAKTLRCSLGHVRCWDVEFKGSAAVCTAFTVEFSHGIENLANGRTFSSWAEEICRSMKIAILHAHKDVKGSDGTDLNGDNISIKTFTAKALRFQRSVNTGAGRTCTAEDLRVAIEENFFHIVFDITNLAYLRITALPREMVLAWLDAGLLTPSGFNNTCEFYDLVAKTASSLESLTTDTETLCPGLRERNEAHYKHWLAKQPLRTELKLSPDPHTP